MSLAVLSKQTNKKTIITIIYHFCYMTVLCLDGKELDLLNLQRFLIALLLL